VRCVDVECSSQDLTLILDSSVSSVSRSDWTKMTSFVGRLVSDLRRRGVARRIAVVTYNHRARVALSLAAHDVSHVTSLSLIAGHGRNIADALRLARTSVRSISFLHIR